MKIEEEVEVRQFSTDWQRATVNILYTSNWLNLILEKRAAKMQITLQQFNVLRILRGQFPHAASNLFLKNRMISNTSDISRLIDRILAKGLVSRSKSDTDKRAVEIYITPTGLSLLKAIEEEMMLNDVLPNNLSAEEAIQLSVLLDKFRGVKPTST